MLKHKIKNNISILIVSTMGYPKIKGGVNTMVNILASEINKNNKAVIFTPGEWADNNLIRAHRSNTINYTLRLRMPNSKNNNIKSFFGFLLELPRTLLSLKNIIDNENINLIHIQTVSPIHVYFFLLHLIGGPEYIITLRGSDVLTYHDKSWFNRFLIYLSLKGAKTVLTNSSQLAYLAKKYFTFLHNIPFIYNGIPLPIIKPENLPPNELKTYLSLPENYFVSVGSFDYVKGHDILIKAWKLIYNKEPNRKLVLVGDGDYRSEYENSTRNNDCNESILFIGEVSHQLALAIISKSISLILPSRYEGFGNVIIEAGSLKIPVIATNVGGIPDIITNKYNGLLVPKEDEKALAKAILRLWKNEKYRKKLADNLYADVLLKFTSSVMIKSYLVEYKKILNH